MNIDASLLFAPDKQSGQRLRASLNRSFASSFEHIFEACRPHVDLPDSLMSSLVPRLRNNSRESPYLYSLHFRLIDAIQEDRLAEVATLLQAIAETGSVTSNLVVTDLRPDVFPWDVNTVSGYFSAEEAAIYRYCAPGEADLPDRRAQVMMALELLRVTAPGLHSEFGELITTIIFAQREKSQGDDRSEGFGGASALRAFGGILLNVEIEPTVVDCAASLAHEHAHNVLFALSPMEGVVENSEDERFSSPLRHDARPLEGIFHATFVLARMVYVMDMMRASGLLSDEDDKIAAVIQTECTPLFFDGLKTVHDHARCTPQGTLAMAAAEDYMTEHA